MIISGIPLWVADTNAWIVAAESGGAAVVIDAPPGDDQIATVLAENDLTPVALLATHGHVDHIGGAGAVARRWALSAYIHPADEYLYADPVAQMRVLWGMAMPGDFEPPQRWDHLEHDQTLSLAGLELSVIHTPGHTPGHCCFHLRSEGALFSGDQLFAGSIGRTDLPGGSYEELMTSMRDRVVTLDPETSVFPGHGPTTTLAAELATNPFLQDLHT